MIDSRAPEVEVIDFVHALVRLVKPSRCLQVPTWLGAAAIAIGRALRANGFGTIDTVDRDGEPDPFARRSVDDAGLADVVRVRGAHASFAPPPYDLVMCAADAAHEVDWSNVADGAAVLLHGDAADGGMPLAPSERAVPGGRIAGLRFRSPRGTFVGAFLQGTRDG